MAKLQLFYSDLYTGAISDKSRFPKTRYREVRRELDRRGLTGTSRERRASTNSNSPTIPLISGNFSTARSMKRWCAALVFGRGRSISSTAR
jgi:hypothetical protein